MNRLFTGLTLMCVAATALAHEVWVTAPDRLPEHSILQADLSYSHNFPQSAKIDADREHIFEPLHLIAADGKKQNLKQHGENYQYRSAKPLHSGSYWVSGVYRPTYWSKNTQGWAQKNLQEMPDATYCELSQMFGKKLLVVGKQAADESVYSMRLGDHLEIVPLADPTTVQVGKLFPVQVWFEGKPLAGATLTATADTVVDKDPEALHDHRELQAFSAKTDKTGKVNVLPLVEGLWKLKVVYSAPLADKRLCQQSMDYATLIVPIGTNRSQASAHVHHMH